MAIEPVEPRRCPRACGRRRLVRRLAGGASAVGLMLLGACAGRSAPPGPLVAGGQLAIGLAALERAEAPGAALRLAPLPARAAPPQPGSEPSRPALRPAPPAPPPAPRKPARELRNAWLPELKPAPSRAADLAAGAPLPVWPAPLKPGLVLLAASAPVTPRPPPPKPGDVPLAAIEPAAGSPPDQARRPAPEPIAIIRDAGGRPGLGAAIAVAEPDQLLPQLDRAAREALLAGDATTALATSTNACRSCSRPSVVLASAARWPCSSSAGTTRPRCVYQLLLDADASDLGARIALLGVLADRAPDEALRLLRRLARHHPQDARLPAQIAMVLAHTGELAAAIAEQHRAVALAPANLGHQVNLAILHDRAGHQGAAALAYRRALELATLSGAPSAQLGPIAARLQHLHRLQQAQPVPAQAPR